MVKTLQKSSSPEPVDRFQQNSVCNIGDLRPIIVCSNDDPVLTYFMATSNFVTYLGFSKGKVNQRTNVPVNAHLTFGQVYPQQ